jgi:hypothetical protein
MRLKRNATNETVPLEDGFLWSDEFAWKPIEQNQEYAGWHFDCSRRKEEVR